MIYLDLSSFCLTYDFLVLWPCYSPYQTGRWRNCCAFCTLLNIPHDRNSPIRLLHPSFRNFILDGQRCSINKDKIHGDVANKCLELMSTTLKRNICNLPTPSASPEEVESDQYHHNLPPSLHYACLYLFEHFSEVGHFQLDLFHDNHVYRFFRKDFLHWPEAMSLMAKMSEGEHIITRLESMLEVSTFMLSWDSSRLWLCYIFSLGNILLYIP